MQRFLLYMAIIGALSLHCTQSTGGGDDVTTGKVFGRLYYQDGSFARNCRVTIVPSDLAPVQDQFPSSYQTLTDNLGRYFLDSVPSGNYNIFGKIDTLASYLDSISIRNAPAESDVPNDTLKPCGRISGTVRLSASQDSRIVLILIIGSTLIRWPDSSIGHFLITGLAEGVYHVRFLAMDSRYSVLDTVFSVVSGKTTDVGTVLLTIPGLMKTVSPVDSADTVIHNLFSKPTKELRLQNKKSLVPFDIQY